MGRSMSLVTPEVLLKTIHVPASIQDKNSNAHIDVEVRDGKLYQTQYEKGADGQEIYRDSPRTGMDHRGWRKWFRRDF